MTEGLHFCQLKWGNVVNYDELGQLIGLSSLAGHRSSILKAHFKDIVRAKITIILLPFTKTFFLNLKTTLLSLIFLRAHFCRTNLVQHHLFLQYADIFTMHSKVHKRKQCTSKLLSQGIFVQMKILGGWNAGL